MVSTENSFETDLYEAASNSASWIYESVTNYSIFHALDSERIESEREMYTNLTTAQKVKLGVRAAFSTMIPTLALSHISLLIHIKLFDPNYLMDVTNRIPKLNASTTSFLNVCEAIVVGPFIEELLFREVLQKTILEKGFRMNGTKSIVYSNFLFAEIHPTFRLDLHAYPVFSILNYTTGSLHAPIAAHITNNICKITFSTFFLT